MQHLILLAVVSMLVFYMLIIVGCLCYVGRHGRRASGVLITLLPLNDRGRFAFWFCPTVHDSPPFGV